MEIFRIKQMSPQLHVGDIERSIEFYITQLGFEVEFRYEDFYAGIIKDGCSIHLKAVDQLIAQENKEDLEILFSVDLIDDLFAGLSNATVSIIQPLREMPYGKEFYIADPNGNVIAFVEIGS